MTSMVAVIFTKPVTITYCICLVIRKSLGMKRNKPAPYFVSPPDSVVGSIMFDFHNLISNIYLTLSSILFALKIPKSRPVRFSFVCML